MDSRFYKSGEHSDMTLKTKDGNRHKVHKLILRCQSAFFDRALDPVSGWKVSALLPLFMLPLSL